MLHTTVEYFFLPFVARNKHLGSPVAWGLGSLAFKLRGLGFVSPWSKVHNRFHR